MPEESVPIRRKYTVEFEFSIGQLVRVRGSAIEAHVTALMKQIDGNQYQICWWYNGNRYICWVFAREIQATSEKTDA